MKRSAAVIDCLVDYVNVQLLDGDGGDLKSDTPLLELGILDSLSMVSFLAYVDDRFLVKIPENYVVPEHFSDLDSIAKLISTLQKTDGISAVKTSELARMVKLQESYGLASERIGLPGNRSFHSIVTEGASPSWLLIPALGNPSTSWSPIMRNVHGQQKCVALDLAGFGLSECGKDDPTFGDHLEMMIQYIETLEKEQVVLIANSAGTMLATAIARQFSPRIKALIISGFGLIDDVPAWWSNLQQLSESPDEFLKLAYYKPPKLTGA
ncbi:MAG: alpha/beta fold hydrolase, partial [Pseudomonadales bacterium]